MNRDNVRGLELKYSARSISGVRAGGASNADRLAFPKNPSAVEVLFDKMKAPATPLENLTCEQEKRSSTGILRGHSQPGHRAVHGRHGHDDALRRPG